MSQSPAILWLRDDLRLRDNPALHLAARNDRPVVFVYVLEDVSSQRDRGGASNWWLDKSLTALKQEITNKGGQLVLRRGDALLHLREIADALATQDVFWNRRYAEAHREQDEIIKSSLKDDGFNVTSCPGNVLMEPWKISTKDGGPYRVFTPYWKSLQNSIEPRQILTAPSEFAPTKSIRSDSLKDWGLHPTKPDWSDGLNDAWTPGEAGAWDRLSEFLDGAIADYSNKRDIPSIDATSRLSPYLHFGEISANAIWMTVTSAIEAGEVNEQAARKFLSELAWRDFSYHLLYHYPTLPNENYQSKFDRFPWRDDEAALIAWQSGKTGYPIVDAGMRQLWATGWMHNRVRMVVASFLTKHLLIHWKAGEDWFWDTLVDADHANNAASWQWVAGSGADAAPFFRIFNPITQGEKFDPDGDYVRRWIPEIAELDNKWLHSPWNAPQSALDRAGIVLGQTYPKPIVDHSGARERALEAYNQIKSG
ncbi:MAG: deoxyribodipyrimidine photolyase [Hirschia sp.]|nr:deoxyribodipyrimidine photolyase [Hirschia sp.]MBF19999.1 deoxyribodipyrimidine photolyase [Hirschia sp.]